MDGDGLIADGAEAPSPTLPPVENTTPDGPDNVLQSELDFEV